MIPFETSPANGPLVDRIQDTRDIGRHATESCTDKLARDRTRAVARPCVMRQWWVTHGPERPQGTDKVEWEYFELENGGKSVEWRDEYEA